MTASVVILALAALTFVAIVVAFVAIFQARTARATLRAYEAKHRDIFELDRKTGASSGVSTGIEPAAVPAASSGHTRSTVPVLIVEDEPGVRELIRRILVRSGREVVAVAGPHEALSALHRQPAIALMVVDVVMPEMDGYDLAAEARTLSPAIHVVFMSAFARDPARHPPGDSFLAKPFTAELLTGAVDRALSHSAA